MPWREGGKVLKEGLKRKAENFLIFVWSGKRNAAIKLRAKADSLCRDGAVKPEGQPTNEAMERACLQAISCKEEHKPAKQD